MENLKDKLYKHIIIFSIAIGSGNIIINMITGLPFSYNYKWFSLILFSTLFSYIDSKTPLKEVFRFIPFLMIIFFFMPISFFNSNGNHHNLLAYIFLVLICSTFLFKGNKRAAITSLLIITYIILHIVEIKYPHLFSISYKEAHEMSKVIQVPILFYFTYLILIMFSKAYEESNYELFKLANFDTLTGLYNRRYFNEKLKILKGDDKVTLVLFDLDNFKLVNDNFGHLEGDLVLKVFSKLLKSDFNKKDNILGRWGGDEFVLVSYTNHIKLMKKLLKVKDSFHSLDENYKVNLNVSFGFVKLNDYDEISQAFAVADSYLYKNKVEGKKIYKSD